ncbi:O-aminophenol oxidase PhsA [Streptomyces albireticuli]|uniref:O-aminophenol oxidase PhsA n=1 Tax=Streptomyces albireticuli TaxID=1940 RepID=UPI001E49FE7B|nr:O-aminophenol oxidase PhsA [Streptomyces albireticuli]MCD9141773.1 multicopper oxidase domain-containing protein [Streptomyces albireticuli]MCD9163283.1 multicopper oxidase domain-containing protein [Streptomyces albireticuli]MCD9189947.1 multicopper oxidase domain-containing protein [Streptomyces albireticuli]
MTETAISPVRDAEAAAGLTPFLDALRVPPLLRPSRAEALAGIDIDLKATWVRLHSQLPPTRVWAYDGHFPGPTIEVRRNRRLRISWNNRLTGTHPVTAVEATPAPGAPPPGDVPGRGDAPPLADVAALPPWTVTHLHGAPTGGGNDGWSENAVSPGDSQLSEYPNDHRAVAWWYHDHAMDITRWNVFAGLAGMYLVRDDEEDALRLPRGEHEIPLILQDRNLDLDEDGRPTGGLLHKTVVVGKDAHGKNVTAAFTGPYTLVNGVIWPYLDVSARWYRFRLLNGANARVFRLRLVDDETGEPVEGAAWQIGTDGGLLPRPVPLDGPLPVAPAERMDLLVDFGRLRGRRIRLDNVAPGVAHPRVMQFRVDSRPVRDPFVLPPVISGSFRRITHGTVPGHEHRLIVLTPPGTAGDAHPGLWEMHPAKPGEVPVPGAGVIQVKGADGTVRTYRRGARTFDDALGFMVTHGAWEQWSFLNLGGPTHPMHIHLIDFQVLGRDVYPAGAGSPFDTALGGTRAPLEFGGRVPVSAHDAGWKDVIQVPAGQMVNVIGRFQGAKGRFMYHCHLLEHEDMGMMRPFVVMPGEVLKFHHGETGGHHGGHHDGS